MDDNIIKKVKTNEIEELLNNGINCCLTKKQQLISITWQEVQKQHCVEGENNILIETTMPDTVRDRVCIENEPFYIVLKAIYYDVLNPYVYCYVDNGNNVHYIDNR